MDHPINFAPTRRMPGRPDEARGIPGSSTVIDLAAIARERMRSATAAADTAGDAGELLRIFDETAADVEAEALAGVRTALARLREDFRRRVEGAAEGVR